MVDRTDEEQIEAIKEWWRENGTAIVVGIVIGIAALFGWRGWIEYQDNRAREASSLYQEMLAARASAQDEPPQEIGERLMADFSDTPYAGLAALLLAQEAVNNDDLKTAEGHLRQALKSLNEASLTHVVRLRLVRVLLAQDEYDAALALINQTDFGRFTAEYEALRGDILLARDDIAGARDAYRLALANMPPQAGGRGPLQMKLESLGVVDEDETGAADSSDTADTSSEAAK